MGQIVGRAQYPDLIDRVGANVGPGGNEQHIDDPACRRKLIGRSMLDKLVSKLSQDRRNRIMLEVRETNLDAQLFFRHLGFRAISVLRDFYEDTTEDAYLMQYRFQGDASEVEVVDGAGRRLAG